MWIAPYTRDPSRKLGVSFVVKIRRVPAHGPMWRPAGLDIPKPTIVRQRTAIQPHGATSSEATSARHLGLHVAGRDQHVPAPPSRTGVDGRSSFEESELDSRSSFRQLDALANMTA